MEKMIETFLAFAERHPRLKSVVAMLIKWLFSGVTNLDERSAPMWTDADEDAYADVT